MKLLIVSNYFWPEDFRINELAFQLAEKGHDVTVMTGIPNYPKGKFYDGYGFFRKRYEVKNGVKIHRKPLVPRGSGRRRRLALNYLSSAASFCMSALWFGRKKYDAILVFNISPATVGLPAVLMRAIYKTPVVMWVLDLWPENISATAAIRNPRILGAIRRMMKFIYRRCDRILISSKGFQEKIEEVGGYSGQYTYFPNWIDESETVFSNPENVELPALPEGFRVVFTGNIGTAQDFGTVLSAAELLKDRADIQWVIVGDGREADWVREEIQKRGLQDCVSLPGRFPSGTMPWFYDQADALLLPLRKSPVFELTVPRKMQAYLAAGRPVIASMGGDGAAIIEEADAGAVSYTHLTLPTIYSV